MFRLWKMYRILVIGKPTAFYWFMDHESLRSSGPQKKSWLLTVPVVEVRNRLDVSCVSGVLTITCISCIQRDNICFQFKHCILSSMNITASKDLVATRVLSDKLCVAEHVVHWLDFWHGYFISRIFVRWNPILSVDWNPHLWFLWGTLALNTKLGKCWMEETECEVIDSWLVKLNIKYGENRKLREH